MGEIPGLEIDFLHDGRVAVFTIAGQISRTHFDRINEILQQTVEGGCTYLVGDCSRASRITSTGVGMIGYYAANMKQRGGELIMVRPSSDAAVQVLDVARLGGLARLFDGLDEALEYVSTHLGRAAPPGLAVN